MSALSAPEASGATDDVALSATSPVVLGRAVGVDGHTVAQPATVALTLRSLAFGPRSPRLLGILVHRLGWHDPALGGRVDAEVVVKVRRGGVGLFRLLEGQVERGVDHLPAGLVGPVHEGDRDAGGPGPTGAADPVDVVLVVLGALVVDHVGDTLDVDAAGGHVGGDQHVDLALAEALERLLPGHLVQVAVDRGRREPAFGQIVGDPLRRALGPAEDHHPVAVLGLQDARDDLGLVEVVSLVDELRRGRHRGGGLGGLGPDVDRVAQMPTGHGDDRRRHGRGEQHGLAQLGGLGQDPLDVGQEAEVEHLVGLVEDQHLDVAQIQ